tara:strand:- start:108 stop:500 length:393 start_codon:yes stop_codon:yes gene_type:complete
MPVKKKLKTVKTNVVKLPKKNNISLDKKDGVLITSLDYYKNRDLERWLTIDDCLLLIPNLLKKRTWESWRSHNKENGEQIGPQYKIFGFKVYKIKVIWLCSYVKGLNWEQQPQQTATNNISQPRTASGNI